MDDDHVIQIDDQRSITISTPNADSLVLAVEDPQTVAIVEMKKPDVIGLYEALEDWIKQ